MLKVEYSEVMQSIYDRATQMHPELKDILVLYNTNCKEGVEVSKGIDKDAGSYRISCEGSNDNPDLTLSSFTLGLVLVIYDIKYGAYNKDMATEAEHARFDALYHEFFPDSTSLETLRSYQ